MIKTINFHFLLVIAFLLTGYQAGYAQMQYESMRVAKIDFILENSLSVDSNLLRARLQTKVGNLFSQSEFDRDLKLLATDYDLIEPNLDIVNGELYINLRLWPKPIIHEIHFCGNERVKTKRLRQELAILPDSVFDREEFIEAFNCIKAYYLKKGYFEAEIDYEIVPIGGCNEVNIEILIKEGRAGKIKEICFEGIDSCEQKELLELMYTKKYQFLFSWLTHAGSYNDDMIEHDRLTILNYFQNEGFADANVDLIVLECEESDRIIIQILIDKGQRYHFGTISFEGNCIFSDDEIWDQFEICEGEPYSPEQLRCTSKAIHELYGCQGYIETVADYQISLHDDEPVYDITFHIDEGQQYRVGLIKVFGNTCTMTKVILHECLLIPGEIFDIRRLQGTERRLLNMGYFCNVNVYAVKSQSDQDCDGTQYRDVHIEVEETDTGHLGLFFGFSTQDSLFGGVELCEQNFNHRGLVNVFSEGAGSLRGGGEYLNMKFSVGSLKTTYLLQWTKPYFMDTPWIVGFDIEKAENRAISSDYDIDTIGFNLNATYPVNEFFKTAWHYRLRQTDVTINGNPSPAVLFAADHDGLVSATGFSFIYDSTDSPRRPSCGLRSRFDIEYAGLGGDYDFIKFGYINTLYIPLCDCGVFKTRADVVFISPFNGTTADNLPLSERLFLGGETTVRGYRPYMIGPLLTSNDPKGGISSYLLSAEYQHYLFPRVDGFVFVDAGFVADSKFTIGDPSASYGIGLRIEVMRNIPMTFGLGFPIDADPDRVKRFFFSIGGHF